MTVQCRHSTLFGWHRHIYGPVHCAMLLYKHQMIQKSYQKETLMKPEAFWNQLMWSDETETEFFGHSHHWNVWRKPYQLGVNYW